MTVWPAAKSKPRKPGWGVSDGVRTALAAAGRMNPPEFADLRATPDRLSPFVESTGGGTAWLEDGVPSFRRTQAGRNAVGRGWSVCSATMPTP